MKSHITYLSISDYFLLRANTPTYLWKKSIRYISLLTVGILFLPNNIVNELEDETAIEVDISFLQHTIHLCRKCFNIYEMGRSPPCHRVHAKDETSKCQRCIGKWYIRKTNERISIPNIRALFAWESSYTIQRPRTLK